MVRSIAMWRRTHAGDVPTHAALAAWCLEGLPNWGTIWRGCAWRLRAWRIPPRWSAGDWFEELEAEGVAAAWQAVRAYDPVRGIPLSAFVRRRVLFGVRTRYRQEWAYARHCGCEPPADGDADARPSDAQPSAPDAHEALQGPLARLPESDRGLIDDLFWGGRTEADIAGELGISQPTVSRRKRAIMLRLRHSFEISRQEVPPLEIAEIRTAGFDRKF
jgi:DNA-directed RNA polymerase specialized sigma24 family protein